MLKLVGDVCFTDNHFDVGFGVGSVIKAGFNPFARIEKKGCDLWIGNFESVVSNATIYSDYHRECFRIDPKYLEQCAFFDYFGVANNHAMEHGPDAYDQMCSFLGSMSKGVFGSNNNRSVKFTHQGKRVSITGFSLRDEEGAYKPSYWQYPECSELLDECQNIDADYKIAYIHWGVEFINHPSVEQVRLAHWLIDVGYDLVIGMHPHILQGFEVYKGKHIFYSLGNFVFNMAYEPTKYSAIVNVDVQTGEVSYNYVKIGPDYAPALIMAKDVPFEYSFDHLNTLVYKFQNTERYIQEASNGLKNYRKSHHKAFIRNICRYDFRILKSIVFDYIKRRFRNGN